MSDQYFIVVRNRVKYSVQSATRLAVYFWNFRIASNSPWLHKNGCPKKMFFIHWVHHFLDDCVHIS